MLQKLQAINDEEEPEDPATGGQDDAHGRTPPRNWTLCARSKREMRSDRWAIYSDTEELLQQITTMVVYLGVGKQADDRVTATGGQDDAHRGTLEVTEDA